MTDRALSRAFDDGEAQLLATLHNALARGRPTDRRSLEAYGACYRTLRADWSRAYPSLEGKGLITGGDGGYGLTSDGRPLARALFTDRPDYWWYFYRRFYQAAPTSAAYGEFCSRVYGANLCQHGLTDMAALEDLMGKLAPSADQHLLDLGCGPGTIAGHVAERTGAAVTGLDYSREAVEAARARFADRSSLSFLHADMNALALPAGRFDGAYSIDTLYFVNDIGETLAQLLPAIKPGGRLAIFYMQWLDPGEPRSLLAAERTWAAQALDGLGLAYRSWDYSRENQAFWARLRQARDELAPRLEAEGNGFIAEHWKYEVEDVSPRLEAGEITRYLYLAHL